MSKAFLIACVMCGVHAVKDDKETFTKLKSGLGLPADIVLLHGGHAQSVAEVMRKGIPMTGNANEMKLGPGLYTTVYRTASGNWTHDTQDRTWRSQVWRATKDLAWSESFSPFVLVAQLLGEAKFALMPRGTPWYEDMEKWSSNPNKAACLSEFDAILIPHTTYDEPLQHDQKCKEAFWLMGDKRNTKCEALSHDEVVHLIDAGCVQELKINPGRESLLDMVAIGVHKSGHKLDKGFPLTGKLGSASDETVEKLLNLKTTLKEARTQDVVEAWSQGTKSAHETNDEDAQWLLRTEAWLLSTSTKLLGGLPTDDPKRKEIEVAANLSLLPWAFHLPDEAKLKKLRADLILNKCAQPILSC